MTVAATVVRPLSHLRPTVKARVAATTTPPSTPTGRPAAQIYWCGLCAHPLAEHDEQGCNHLDTAADFEQLCSCATPGGAR